ncbi:MAG: thiamine phosphate synthase [Gemmatimonadota bacterium]
MNVPFLHVIVTDDVTEAPTFLADAEDLIAAGRDRLALHLRLRRTNGRDLHELAARLGRAAADSGAWCVINDRVDVALTSGARAVQLGRGSLPVDAVRRLGEARFAIGASVHSADEARRRATEGADFLVAGSVFATATHPDRAPAGPALVTACVGAGVPVVGIGGIDAGNARQVVEAGAAGVAVIRAVWQAANPVQEALGLIDLCVQKESEGGCFA